MLKCLRNHEYTKQTAEVRGMLVMLDAQADAVTMLGLSLEVEALRKANATFDTQYYTRTAESGARMAQSNVKSEEVVEKVNKLYNEIVMLVNAYAVVQPTDTINTFIGNVNGAVAAFSRIAGSSTSGNGEVGEGEAPDPIPGGGGDGDDGESPDPIV